MNIVGLPDTAVQEARERVRAALNVKSRQPRGYVHLDLNNQAVKADDRTALSGSKQGTCSFLRPRRRL